MDSLEIPRKLWEHPDPSSTAMYSFLQAINGKYDLKLKTFWELYQFSIARRSHFWAQLLDSSSLIYTGSYSSVVDEHARIDSIPKWFEGLHCNFAENVLYTRGLNGSRSKIGKEDDKIALIEVREGGSEIAEVTWAELREKVVKLAEAMRSHGFVKGDRIMVVASNSVDTLVVWLATTALGGLFSSSSTDMGVRGILQRTVQVEPKYIFIDDTALYNGKTLDLRQKMTEISDGMKSTPNFCGIVSIPRFSKPLSISNVPETVTLSQFLSKASSAVTFDFERTSFNDPFYIAYSSGTTGTPKCIVHRIGGCLLSAYKEAVLHRELGPDSTVLQYTTTGWIMYYFTVVSLFLGCKVVLYDGSPFIGRSGEQSLTRFIELVGELKVSMLGTSPRYLAELHKGSVVPKKIADLSHLKMVTSTGMVLPDQLFEWFYDTGFPPRVHLANISGGTDLAGCFGQENPLTPVYVGGTQGPSLGTPVAIFDSLIEGGKGIKGQMVEHGTPGELVAPAAFPNMPVYFWNDDSGQRYFSAYFEKYDNVWTHGDFVMIHPKTNNLLFLGRADGVLNPSGVRFGSAEIYSVLDAAFPAEIADSICVGQRRPTDPDESVMLFILMRPNQKFTRKLVSDVKSAIRKQLSSRHVPKWIFETPEIPTTVNLKKVELPVKQIVSGKIIKPSGTLLNPESLDYYYQFAKVEELADPQSKL